MRSTLLVALLLVSLSGALCGVTGPWGSFLYDGLAITNKGRSQNLVLEPLRTNDANQTWRYEDGYVVSKTDPDLVWDIKQASLASNSPVIAYSKRESNKNQWWTINTNNVKSSLAANLYLKVKTGTFEVVTDYATDAACPPPFKFVEPKVGPLTCASYGDPHMTCWSGTKFDFQFPGTVLLAQFNNHRIHTTQGSCGPGYSSGVTCNKGIVIKPAQGTDYVQIQWNGDVRVNGVLTTVSTQLVVNAYITVKKLGRANYRVDIEGGYVTTYDFNFYVTILSGTIQPSICACDGALSDGHSYGLSHALQNQSDSTYTYPANEPFVYDPDYVPQYEFNHTNAAFDACAPLQVGPLYDACHEIVDPWPYYKPCLDDVTASNSNGTDIAQLSIAAYTWDCNEKATKQNKTVVLPTDAYASAVSIPAAHNQTWDFSLSFYITAKDALGNSRTVGGDAFVVTATSGPAPISFTVQDLGNGTYKVSYSPSKVGTYVVSIKLAGKDVGGTPVTVNVQSGMNIIYNGKALTYKGRGLSVTLEPLIAGNTKQSWTVGGGFVTSVYWNTQVLDSKDGSIRASNPLITWDKKVPTAINQQFSLTTSPQGLLSALAAGYYARVEPSNNVILNYTTPVHDFYYI